MLSKVALALPWITLTCKFSSLVTVLQTLLQDCLAPVTEDVCAEITKSTSANNTPLQKIVKWVASSTLPSLSVWFSSLTKDCRTFSVHTLLVYYMYNVCGQFKLTTAFVITTQMSRIRSPISLSSILGRYLRSDQSYIWG